MLRLLLALALALALIPNAFAADAAATTIDLAKLINEVVIPIASLAIAAIGVWLTPKLKAWLGEDAGAKAAAVLDTSLHYALAYGQAKAGEIAPGMLVADVKSATVAHAIDYAMQEFPDLLKRNGITEASLKAKLEARYAYNTTPPEKSAAIPTPPAAAVG